MNWFQSWFRFFIIVPKEIKIMKLEVVRYSSQKEDTLGLLFDVTNGREFLCYTLEDEFRTKKVFKETRIPAGTYKIKLRTEGGHHQRYSKKFASIHKGMLWLQDVPNFKWILIHIGNTDDDTAGCLLVGNGVNQNVTEEGRLRDSTSAYKRIYLHILEAIDRGEEIEITYKDFDHG